MGATIGRTFLVLIVCQALHSVEEYSFSLWDVLEPARYVSSLVSTNLALGFAVLSTTIVALGLWSYWVPVRLHKTYAPFVIWFWVYLEIANGVGHIGLAIYSQGYFPGMYTAPLLLAASGLLVTQLIRTKFV